MSYPPPQRTHIWFLLLWLGFLSLPTAAGAEVTGGPGYAKAAFDLSINDEFSGNTLETHYQLLGIQGTAPVGSAFQEDGLLHLMAGPTTSEVKSLAAIQRYFYGGIASESFHLQIDAGIGSGSSLLGTAGLAVVNPLNPQEAVTLVGLAKLMIPGYERSWVFTDIPGIAGAVTQPFDVSLDALHSLILDFDASTSTMIISVPDADFFKVAVLPAYQAGFEIVLVSQTGAFLNTIAQSEALFDNLESDLTADPYLVSYTPFSLNGVTYDDALSSDPTGGNAVYYTMNVPTFSLARVAVDDTWLQLDGERSYSAALVSFGSYHSTIYTELDCASFQAGAPAGVVLDRFVNHALIATGASHDYVWNPFPAVFSADCGYASQVAIWGFAPASAAGGSKVTIVGYNFGAAPGSLWVGGIPVMPETWANERITFYVPTELTAGTQTITVANQTESASLDFVVLPAITSLSPTELTSSTRMILTGTGFGTDTSKGFVSIDDQLATIVSWQGEQISVDVPKKASPGEISVIVTVNGVTSNQLHATVFPYVYWLSFSLVKNTPTLTIKGRNLGTPRPDLAFAVLVDGQALPTFSWSAESIQCNAPSTLTNGNHTLQVVSANLVSNLVGFSISHNQLTVGYLSASTSPGNSEKLKETPSGGMIPGGVLVDFAPGTITFLDDTTIEPIDRVSIASPQLAGMLKGIGANFFERRTISEGHPDSYFIYFNRYLSTSTVRGILSLAKEVREVVPLVVPESYWSETFNYPDPQQTNDYNLGKLTAVRVPRANALERGSPAEWIAVIDHGFPNTLSDLTANIRPGSNLPDSAAYFHGAIVSTICCAASNNYGAAGVAPESALGFYSNSYSNTEDLQISAFYKEDFNHSMQIVVQAVNDGAAAVNISWGAERPSDKFNDPNVRLTQADFDSLKRYWQAEIKALLDKHPHVNLVAAVPNWSNCYRVSGTKTATDSIPSNLDSRIIAVGGEIACNTSWVQVGAPTGWMVTKNLDPTTGTFDIDGDATVNQTDVILKPWYGYTTYNLLDNRLPGGKPAVGTSFATPVVTGVAALIHAWNPNLTGSEVQTTIKNTASTSRVPSGYYQTSLYGKGYVDAYAALQYAEKLRVGTLYVVPMEAMAKLHSEDPEIPLNLLYTVDEDTNKSVSISLRNDGDGVLFFQGWAYRCLDHGFLGVCIKTSTDIHFESATISGDGHHSFGDSNLDEGYIRPGKYHYVYLNISGVGMKAGDTYDGTIYFFTDSDHNDTYNSNYFWMNVKVTVTAPIDCVTSRALVGTPMESQIPGLRSFRDDYMVPQRTNGQKWASLYRTYGPEIVKGFDQNAPQVYVYRELVEKFGPSLIAKELKETGLGFLADQGKLDKIVTKEDVLSAQDFFDQIARANPAFADIGQRLSKLSGELEGMTAEEAIEYVTAHDPNDL